MMSMNPMQLAQVIKNPQNVVQQLMNNSQAMHNPIFKNAVDMYQKGDTKSLNTLVNNLCKERGTTIEEVRKQLGI